MGFKKDFVWGAATASFQIEGGAFEDGKGLSTWDVFCERGDKVYQGHTGETACDHYHRYEEDLDLMQELGLKAYRFSLSWPRILPDGIGRVNQKGIDFYHHLIDGLIERGIEPYITLYHWDFPYELYKKGHWLNRESADWFEYYTKVVMEHFGHKVKYYFTVNEPQCFIGLGNAFGEHAPGLQLGDRDIIHMIHHTLLAHGKAVKVIREARPDAMIGFAPVGGIGLPHTAEDIDLARKVTFAEGRDHIPMDQLIWSSATFNDPAFLGVYPEPVRKYMDQYINEDIDADLQVIHQPLDFMGVNIYQGFEVGMENGEFKRYPFKVGHATSHMGWPISEDVLYYGPKFLYERYKKPIYITENGLALPDWKGVDGKVHDPQRIDFLTRYISRYQDAVDEGVDGAGYFQWSFMDNFEWAYGYEKRFGLVHCDFETFERTPKDSYYWYKQVMKNNFAGLYATGNKIV